MATADARTGQHLRVSTVGDPLRLVDLGCGNAYLTFGAYAHMAVNKKEAMRVVGVDVKRQARETNARVASELGWDDACRFVEGDDPGRGGGVRRGGEEKQRGCRGGCRWYW